MRILAEMTRTLEALGVKFTDVLLLVLTAAALVLTWAITVYQWKLSRKQNAINLHAEYYSVDHYAKVVSPIVQIRLRWLHLPDLNERELYRDVIAAGWAPALLLGDETSSGGNRFRIYVHTDDAESDLVHAHYHVPIGSAGLSEHQALAALLHFWSRLAGLLEAKAIDPRLAKQFFAPAYQYNKEFFAGLRQRVAKGYLEGDPYPAWLTHTELLERFFA